MREPKAILQEALSSGRQALTEYEAKQFLSSFGIPVCREVLAHTPEEAAAQAASIGFPVALKASGEKMLHKTEAGGVVLYLKNKEEVAQEGARLLAIPGCEALLISEMVSGAREFVCGLMHDPSFGPAVMFGLGGILTEALKDTTFRIAPLSAYDAGDMMTSIRAAKLLETFRGEAAADKNKLAQILTAIGDIGLQFPEIAEIDINPLIIRADGSPVAVDALIALKS